ncbi:hypothetical protein ACOME3_002725 [Neoechinorhynchus agilis]
MNDKTDPNKVNVKQISTSSFDLQTSICSNPELLRSVPGTDKMEKTATMKFKDDLGKIVVSSVFGKLHSGRSRKNLDKKETKNLGNEELKDEMTTGNRKRKINTNNGNRPANKRSKTVKKQILLNQPSMTMNNNYIKSEAMLNYTWYLIGLSQSPVLLRMLQQLNTDHSKVDRGTELIDLESIELEILVVNKYGCRYARILVFVRMVA